MTALPFRLGYLTHLDGVEDPEDLYDYTLEIARLAESLGYDALWISERHFHDGFAGVADGLTFLAAVAAVTRRIHLGTAIVPAPLWRPVELAERAGIVDALSRGRLEFGIGLGNPGSVWRLLGVEHDRKRELTDETEASLHRLLDGEVLDERGSRVFPPRPQLRDRIWRATADLGSAALAGSHGDGLLLPRARYGAPEEIGPWHRRVAQAYAAELPAGRRPRVGLSRTLFPSSSRAQALAELEAGTRRWNRDYNAGVPDGGQGRTLERLLSDDHVGYGTPDDLIAWLRDDVSLPFVSDLIVGFQPAVTTFEQEAAKLATLATEVAPALGWHPAPRGGAYRVPEPAGWQTADALR